MKCKVRPFIVGHSLFTFYSCVYIFSFRLFSGISQMVLGSSGIRFCREFQVLSLGNKNDFNHRDKREEILSTERLIISATPVRCLYMKVMNLNRSLEKCK